MRTIYPAILLFSLVALIHGCSGGDDLPVIPDPDPPRERPNAATSCMGVWQFAVDWESCTLDVILLRQANKALNAVHLLEPPAGVNIRVKIGTLVIDPYDHVISADVVLKHPITPTHGTFHGFDVRGIVFGPQVTNADGLSAYFNPDDFTGTPYGYIDGLLGVPDSVGHYANTFNGYKYFCDGLGAEDNLADFFSDPANVAGRGIFTEGSKNVRRYDLYFGPNPDKFAVFNYAVYASHVWPAGKPPFDVDDFPVTAANQAEPVFAEITEISNSLTYNSDFGYGSGAIGLQIDIFDWLKPSEPNPVWIESPGVIPLIQADYVEQVDEHRTRYFIETQGTPLTAGRLDITIIVEDEKTYGEHYFLDLMTVTHPLYDRRIVTKFMHRTNVEECDIFPYIEPFDGSAGQWSLTGNWTLEPANSLLNNQDDTNCYAAYLCDAVSPAIPVPQSDDELILMMYHTVDVEDDYDEMYVQVNGTTVWPAKGMLHNDHDGAWTGELSSGWSAFELGTGFNGDWVTIRFVSDADGSNQCQVNGFYGWQVHHLMLGFAADVDFPPIINSIDGPNDVSTQEPQAYSSEITDYNGTGDYDYRWEIGDDVPPLYDDGPGNGDGTIDIAFPHTGEFLVDLRIDNPCGPPSTALKPLLVTYFELPPNSIIEDFENPLSGEWSFNDLTVGAYGQHWGLVETLGEGALDVDGDDDGCYDNHQFADAAWQVTIPASSYAILKLKHMISAEDSPPDYCYDGAMVAIDGAILSADAMVCGWKNSLNNGVFEENIVGYLPPSLQFAWSGESPSYPDAFDVSHLDISTYADGGLHTISLLFDADGTVSCEDGDPYTSWSIAEMGIYYE